MNTSAPHKPGSEAGLARTERGLCESAGQRTKPLITHFYTQINLRPQLVRTLADYIGSINRDGAHDDWFETLFMGNTIKAEYFNKYIKYTLKLIVVVKWYWFFDNDI